MRNTQFTTNAKRLGSGVGEADTACLDLHEDLTRTRRGQLDLFDDEFPTSLFEGGPGVVRWERHCRGV